MVHLKKKSFMNYYTLLLLYETLNIQDIKRHLTQFVFKQEHFRAKGMVLLVGHILPSLKL